MTLWSDIAIQQFLIAIGKDLGPSGIDGELGDKGSDSYSRRAIASFQGDYGLDQDTIWGEQCQRKAKEVLTNGIQLTTNFNSSELGCGIAVSDDPNAPHDDDCMNWPDMINLTALSCLQATRDRIGPIQVTSGVRCRTYNDWLSGSSSESKHMAGRAFDCNAMGAVSYETLLQIGLECGFTWGYVGDGYVHLEYDGPGF